MLAHWPKYLLIEGNTNNYFQLDFEKLITEYNKGFNNHSCQIIYSSKAKLYLMHSL